MKSTSTEYGRVAVLLHWISALLIVGLMISGGRAEDAASDQDKISILALHAPLGLSILLLTLARIAWWVFADKQPAVIANAPAWQTLSAKAVHGLFYLVILGMVASGIATLRLSGAGEIIFFSNAALPDFADFAPRIPHGIGAKLIIILFVAHAGAALYHHFVKRDGTLGRMWFKPTQAPSE